MIHIAIVEDDRQQAAQLEGVLKQYSGEFKVPMEISIFYNAVVFLENYSADWDIVFMDIMMPMMDGMEASHRLREKDEKVMLIFVTSMQQFAIQGYEVGAFDFVVKPVHYAEFKLKFTRAMSRLPASPEDGSDVLIHTETGYVRLSPAQITYVEVRGHHCVYHTKSGEYRQYQTMKSVEEKLAGQGFARCNNFLLVNLAYVTRVEGMDAYVGGVPLQISHPRRKEFTRLFAEYSGSKKYE